MAKDDKNTAIYIAFDENEPFDPVVPEKNLLKAVLLSAFCDLKKNGEMGRKAREYFLNSRDDYIFSFIAICNHLSLDPKKVLRYTGLLPGAVINHERENKEALDYFERLVEA